MAQIQPFPCYEYGDGLQRPHVRKRDRARYVRPIRHDDRRAPLLRRAHRASVARPVASFRRIVPDCQPITTEGDACGLTFAARVSRDEDEFYSHAELQGVERSATEILRYYILAEWYLSIRANDLWTAYTQKLTAAVATLSSYLFRFYRPVLRRAHRVSPCPEEYSQHGEIQIIDAGLV